MFHVLKAAVSMNLNEILGRSKRDKKVKKNVLKHNLAVKRTGRGTPGQLFGVRLPIFNFKF